MKHLFIGGSRDGETIDLLCDDKMVYIRKQVRQAAPVLDASVNTIEFTEEVYISEPFHVASQKYYIYRWSQLTLQAMFEMLLGGYKP